MNERPLYLESLNMFNFRHGEENPRVIGLVHLTPENYSERPCFKVEYESDNKIDFIPYYELVVGNWKIV